MEREIAAVSTVRSKALQRGVDFVTLCLGLDAPCAELILEKLARRLGRRSMP